MTPGLRGMLDRAETRPCALAQHGIGSKGLVSTPAEVPHTRELGHLRQHPCRCPLPLPVKHGPLWPRRCGSSMAR